MQPKNLFLIDGAAGSGKSDLIEFVQHHIVGKRATILNKCTTRNLREEEKRTSKSLDLTFVDDKKFDNLKAKGNFYCYYYPRKGGARYGFYFKDLKEKLENYDNVFLIVRSASTIKDIIADFPEMNVVPIFIYTVETKIKGRLEKDGYTKEEIEYRLSRSDVAMDDLYTHPTLYDCVIINNSDKATYQRQLKERFDKMSEPKPNILRISAKEIYPLPSVLIPHKDNMVSKLKKYSFNKNIFVMMKYKEKNKGIFDLIQVVIENAGYNCVRADIPEWDLTHDDIYNPFAVLHCCKYGIALFDEPEENYIYNANVAIELAIMHMQDKRCLMLKQKDLPPPPFDLASKIYRTYNRVEELVAIIKRWVTRL